jgi:transcriptional regulator with GAF, ATPase, and Fis domain
MPDPSADLATFAARATVIDRRALAQAVCDLVIAWHPGAIAVVATERRGQLVVRGSAGIVAGGRAVPCPPLTAHLTEAVRTTLAADLLPERSGSPVVLPVPIAGRWGGVLLASRAQPWSPVESAGLEHLLAIYGLALHGARLALRLDQALAQLAGTGSEPSGPPPVARTRSPAMRNAVELARQAAASDAPVLVSGETGSGKELLARAIHAWSRRADGPFVAVNCAALPAGLVESELFGHAAGAFSGALAARAGRFALADGGTLMLDEIGELAAPAQAALLRVLQEGRYEAVGSDESREVDVRIVAATNRDLEAEVAAGRFRADLWYRLAVVPVHLPPLRERRADIVPIAEDWLARRAESGRGPWRLSATAAARLEAHDWPGNIRELLNALERAVIVRPRGEITAEDIPLRVRAAAQPRSGRTLAEVQAEAIRAALARCGGRIYGPGGAAESLGLKPTTLQSRMKRLGVARQA